MGGKSRIRADRDLRREVDRRAEADRRKDCSRSGRMLTFSSIDDVSTPGAAGCSPPALEAAGVEDDAATIAAAGPTPEPESGIGCPVTPPAAAMAASTAWSTNGRA